MEDAQTFTGQISEAAIFDLAPGRWTRQLALENAEDAQNAVLTILRTDKEGPFLIVAGDLGCRNEIDALKRIFTDLKSGALVLIEYSGATARALESPSLWPLVDAVDEVIVAASSGAIPWAKLENPRFRSASKETLLREALRSMGELGLIGSDVASRILAKTTDGHVQSVT